LDLEKQKTKQLRLGALEALAKTKLNVDNTTLRFWLQLLNREL
jgi:hypothetical protein